MSLKGFELDSVSCTIFPGKYDFVQRIPALYNEAYEHWKKIWLNVFTDSASPESFESQNFLRQNLVITLHHQSHIIGLMTMTSFQLDAKPTYDHFYFRPFPWEVKQLMHSSRGGFMLTTEYLSIDPDYRKSEIGVPLSDALYGIAMKVFSVTKSKFILATSVRTRKMHEMCNRYGCQDLGTYKKYGLDCSLHINFPQTLRPHPDPVVSALTDRLWLERIDHTQITNVQNEPLPENQNRGRTHAA